MPETPEIAEARAVWDFTIGEPDKFAMRLEDMRDTLNAFAERGMKTRFAMIVRGPASKLLMRNPPAPATPAGADGPHTPSRDLAWRRHSKS